MEILSIIPARGDSKGIPLKNIIKINKKPLLYYTVNASLKSKLEKKYDCSDIPNNERQPPVAIN